MAAGLGLALSIGGWTVAALSLALAIMVFRAAPGHPRNRCLAFLILAVSASIGLAWGLFHGAHPSRIANAAGPAGTAGLLAQGPAYLLLMGTFTNVPNGWLRARPVRAVLWALALVPVPWWFLVRRGFAGRIVDVDGIGTVEVGPEAAWAFGPLMAVSLLGLFYAILMWRRAAPGPQKQQARMFLAAFATYDLGQLITMGIAGAMPNAHLTEILLPPFSLIFVALLAYGVLQHQILDIDLRIKAGLGRTVAVGMVVAAVFMGSELIEQMFDIDQTLPAVAVAGAVALVLRPVQRVGMAAAERLMPNVQDEPAYHAKRREEVYVAAVADASSDGELTIQEQAVLEALADRMGLAQPQVQALQRQVARDLRTRPVP